MAPNLPKEVASSIECAIACALTTGRKPDRAAIAAIFNTTHVTVHNISKRVEQRLLPLPIPPHKPAGRPSVITPETVQAVRELLERKPGLDQNAIAEHLREACGVEMRQCTVSRLLKREGIPHKRTNRVHKKMRILKSEVWDAETRARGAPREPFQQCYVSPYATTTIPSGNTADNNANSIPSSSASYVSPFS